MLALTVGVLVLVVGCMYMVCARAKHVSRRKERERERERERDKEYIQEAFHSLYELYSYQSFAR
jgi:hypothetical protein